jgi:hypothetical protein
MLNRRDFTATDDAQSDRPRRGCLVFPVCQKSAQFPFAR